MPEFFHTVLFRIEVYGKIVNVTPWVIYGLIGTLLFTSRWFVQLWYSRKAGKPVTPRLFWIMSMIGSVIVLTYFLFSPTHDPVGVLGNLFPSFVAAYNLYLDLTHKSRSDARSAATAVEVPNLAGPSRRVKTPDAVGHVKV
ncbi:MAG TPA: lipid-A-disaccharide synthase N-terminal domain-containing protein [Planctomycetota bacterium]|jgi:lipid-A-disaccharide synthase-like uncharacterized protein